MMELVTLYLALFRRSLPLIRPSVPKCTGWKLWGGSYAAVTMTLVERSKWLLDGHTGTGRGRLWRQDEEQSQRSGPNLLGP